MEDEEEEYKKGEDLEKKIRRIMRRRLRNSKEEKKIGEGNGTKVRVGREGKRRRRRM